MRDASPSAVLLAALAASATARADAPSLTIYSGDFDAVAASPPGPGATGFALVRETLSRALPAGDSRIAHDGLPAAVDAAGVRLVPRDADVAVGAQRFHFALADQGELLRRAIGTEVTVVQGDGADAREFSGRLLAVGDGVTLAIDGAVVALPTYSRIVFPSLPDGVHSRPTMVWNVRAARAGDAAFALDYPTAGLAWRAEYVATLAGDDDACRMRLEGAAMVLNRSGADFRDAALTLVAGEPNRVAPAQPQVMMMQKASRMEFADQAPTPQASGEYHAYPLPGRTDLADGSVQRVPLVAPADDVRCRRRYESRGPIAWFKPAQPLIEPDYGPVGEQPVQAMLTFGNRRDAGLGMPLPAGRVRAFERGDDGADAFLGEAALAHTASGRDVELALGVAFDLGVERTRETLELATDRRSLTERIALQLRNAKSRSATIRAVEVLPRWSDWEIVESSAKWTRIDAQTIAFDVAVPAGGEATVRYAVRYRWPNPLPN